MSSKVYYKGEDADFLVFVDDASLINKFKEGSVPLVEVVSVFKVFSNRIGGAEGEIGEASKSELENEFGTKDVDAIIKKILQEGSEQPQHSLRPKHEK